MMLRSLSSRKRRGAQQPLRRPRPTLRRRWLAGLKQRMGRTTRRRNRFLLGGFTGGFLPFRVAMDGALANVLRNKDPRKRFLTIVQLAVESVFRAISRVVATTGAVDLGIGIETVMVEPNEMFNPDSQDAVSQALVNVEIEPIAENLMGKSEFTRVLEEVAKRDRDTEEFFSKAATSDYIDHTMVLFMKFMFLSNLCVWFKLFFAVRPDFQELAADAEKYLLKAMYEGKLIFPQMQEISDKLIASSEVYRNRTRDRWFLRRNRQYAEEYFKFASKDSIDKMVIPPGISNFGQRYMNSLQSRGEEM
jgi:hypothetical protein